VNTPSHLIINAALRKAAVTRRGMAIPRGAFLLGAVLPDIPLWLLWAGTLGYHRLIRGDASYPVWSEAYDRLFFGDPLWIVGHNLFHSPALLLPALALLWRARAAAGSRAHWWFWLLAGCLVHTALDIPVHADDGPLLLFPFEWSLRFRSPLSYWDPRYFGSAFVAFELLLNLGLLAYLFGPGLWQRLRRQGAAPQER
jgi:membrane-bound metal-dependent hydrolase YbcI (DUF457 family)